MARRRLRIAVSGTHCSGKSTLIDDFLLAHRDYEHEPEPYEWLQEMYGEEFAAEPDVADYYRQLEVSVSRLLGYGHDARVIVERSPVDFLAYMLALGDLRRGGRAAGLIESAIELAASGIERLDVLVVLPLNNRDGILAPPSEDLELREAMDDRLAEIITSDEFDLFSGGHPRVVQVQGTRSARLAAVERTLAELR